jgi:hypothetical protein
MSKKTGKRMAAVCLGVLVISMFLLSIGTIIVSAEDVEVLYEMYVGNDLSNQENGTAVISRGNGVQMPIKDSAYDATGLGGDDKTIYYQLDIGGLYHNPNHWAKFGGPLAYHYDEVGEPENDHMVVKSITSILPTAWLSMDIRIDGVDGAAVNLNDYYIVIGTDPGWKGDVSQLKLYGIVLSEYMTEADIGEFKRICLPLQDFREGDLDKHIVIEFTAIKDTALLNTMSRNGGMGIICVPQTEREIGELNNLYVDNIKIYSGEPIFNTFNTTFSAGGNTTDVMVAGDITVESNISGYDGYWIVAHYNSSNELVEVAAMDTVSSASSDPKTTVVTCGATDKIKVFLWEDIVDIVPLTTWAELSSN